MDKELNINIVRNTLLEKFIIPLGMTLEEVASDCIHTESPQQKLNDVIFNKKSLSISLMIDLGTIFGVGTEYWSDLQKQQDQASKNFLNTDVSIWLTKQFIISKNKKEDRYLLIIPSQTSKNYLVLRGPGLNLLVSPSIVLGNYQNIDYKLYIRNVYHYVGLVKTMLKFFLNIINDKLDISDFGKIEGLINQTYSVQINTIEKNGTWVLGTIDSDRDRYRTRKFRCGSYLTSNGPKVGTKPYLLETICITKQNGDNDLEEYISRTFGDNLAELYAQNLKNENQYFINKEKAVKEFQLLTTQFNKSGE